MLFSCTCTLKEGGGGTNMCRADNYGAECSEGEGRRGGRFDSGAGEGLGFLLVIQE